MVQKSSSRPSGFCSQQLSISSSLSSVPLAALHCNHPVDWLNSVDKQPAAAKSSQHWEHITSQWLFAWRHNTTLPTPYATYRHTSLNLLSALRVWHHLWTTLLVVAHRMILLPFVPIQKHA